MKMTIWQTPAGIVDEGGVVLQSWLNFGVTLLGPPANGIMHVSHIACFLFLFRKPSVVLICEWHTGMIACMILSCMPSACMML